jgi:hypothetical protein
MLGGRVQPAAKIQYCQTNGAPVGVRLVMIAPVGLLPKYRLVLTERKRADVAVAFNLTHR